MRGACCLLAVVVVALSLAAVPASALTARALGMGQAQTALASDAAAWMYNPAGLAWLPQASPQGKASQLIVGFGQVDTSDIVGEDTTIYHLHAASPVGGPTAGWAAGAVRFALLDAEMTTLGGGFGARFGKAQGWSWGASLSQVEVDVSGLGSSSDTFLDAGVILGGLPVGKQGAQGGTLRIGAVWRDLLGESDATILDAGAALIGTGYVVDVDILDVTNDVDQTVNVGAELEFGKGLVGRVGSLDGDLTVGAGLRTAAFQLDFAYAQLADGDTPATMLSFTTRF